MDALVGSWRLEAVRLVGQRVRYPHGPSPTGWLVYTEGGVVSVVIGDAERPSLGTADPRGGTLEGRATAMASCAAYAGRWWREGDEVVHAIDVAWFPDWTGTRQRRRVGLDGDRLVLESPPVVVDGEPARMELAWRRS